jgi:2,5-diketo-D-gluconate reductase A
VAAALSAGYRLIDTAASYENEVGVGRAIRESGVPRADLFVTTKLANSEQGYDATLRAFDASLRRLELDTVDLYLIHWPMPVRDLYLESWRALEAIHASGRALAIGVSNFGVGHLRRLIGNCVVVPAVNQVELHPGFPQLELRELHREFGVVTEAWSPLARGAALLDRSELAGMAAATGRTPAQIVLRWHLEEGHVVIPKSITPARIRENLDVFDFTLTPEQHAFLDGMVEPARVGPDPETFGSH